MMSVLFMTVPTAGSRPALLNALVRDCGIPRERIVIVTTREEIQVPKGVQLVEDLGPPNIQRWWNTGIREAEARGASAVAVVNDDVSVTSRTLPLLYNELVRTQAAIASPMRDEFKLGLHKRPLIPYSPRLWGSLWVLRLDSGLRPDERYVWWYGDNDLDIRARKSHGGVVSVNVDYCHHHPGEGTASNPALQAQSELDGQQFERQYARLLRLSRLLVRLKLLFSGSKRGARETP